PKSRMTDVDILLSRSAPYQGISGVFFHFILIIHNCPWRCPISAAAKIYGQNDHFRCMFAYAILHLSNYAILPQISTDPQRLRL
ncbi:MAG: hypothetical protein ABS874_01810, partial [Lachnospiraceae bacterium]